MLQVQAVVRLAHGATRREWVASFQDVEQLALLLPSRWTSRRLEERSDITGLICLRGVRIGLVAVRWDDITHTLRAEVFDLPGLHAGVQPLVELRLSA